MAFITAYQHGTFLRCLDTSIELFEKQASKENDFIRFAAELKKEEALLEHIYSEYNTLTEQLRQLANQYQYAKKGARIKLRVYQLKSLKKPICIITNYPQTIKSLQSIL